MISISMPAISCYTYSVCFRLSSDDVFLELFCVKDASLCLHVLKRRIVNRIQALVKGQRRRLIDAAGSGRVGHRCR